MSTIDEVRKADRNVEEILDVLKKASLEELGHLGIQSQQATDDYAKAIRKLPM